MSNEKFFQPLDAIEVVQADLLVDVPLDATDEQIEELAYEEIEKQGELKLRNAASGELEIHKIADRQEAAFFVAVHAAFKVAQSKLRATHDVKQTIAALKKSLGMTLPMLITRAVGAGGELAAEKLVELKTAGDFPGHPFHGNQWTDGQGGEGRKLAAFRAAKRGEKKPKISFTFDKEDQHAIDWADRHAAELIDGISETSRESINNAIADLLESGDWEDAIDEILAAVGDPDRARRIARNEVMTAVSEGQRQAWKQASEEGLLEDVKRTWITVGDDKVCPICEPLDGLTADLDGEYPGDFDGPPAHVACRCTEGLV